MQRLPVYQVEMYDKVEELKALYDSYSKNMI